MKKYTEDYKKEMDLHQINSMHPILESESGQRHLLLTTANGLRLFINFNVVPDLASNKDTPTQVEDLGL